MNFIFNEVPDRFSKNSSLVTSFYRGFVYNQGTIRRRIFSKIETKRRCWIWIWVSVFIMWNNKKRQFMTPLSLWLLLAHERSDQQEHDVGL